MRLFAAVFISSDIAEKIYAFSKTAAEYFKVKAVMCAKMHITVKYFGKKDCEECLKIVENAIEGIRKFEAVVKGVNFFSRSKYADVLWAGVKDKTFSLKKMALSMDNSQNEYIAHITLVRFRNNCVRESLLDKYLSESFIKEKEFGRFTVKKVVLVNSVLRPGINRYEILKEFDLR
ncbi:MAG: RNA 2',3'-cyclic phosphodiesterase [Endomicrobium sp.]|jgi:2'-5' RNA ligase|nr:RNA 2',3'-cyclic phosphodiesterase [Endomicrobium sp.]